MVEAKKNERANALREVLHVTASVEKRAVHPLNKSII